MPRSRAKLGCLLVSLGLLWTPASLAQDAPSLEEQQSLARALTNGATSPVDTIRELEAHLARYSKSTERADIEQALARAALEAGDVERLVLYGEPILQRLPEDVVLLDRVSYGLLMRNSAAEADRAYRYSRTLENLYDQVKVTEGPDAPRQQDERDRAVARALLYQSRARLITGEPKEAVRLASRAFSMYPNEEAARAWAEALKRDGKMDDAIKRLAEAFTIPDPRATDATRLNVRIALGEWYTAKNGSEKGLGDAILSAYDRMSGLMETRRKKLLALDPNAAARTALDFTLTRLNGKPYRLADLKGSVVVMDFWATWCAPCRIQHPLYEELKKKFPERDGVIFLSVNADEERIAVEPFLEEQMWDKNVFYEDGLVRLLNVQQIPATILFDHEGRLASRLDGFDPDTFVTTVTSRIESLLELRKVNAVVQGSKDARR